MTPFPLRPAALAELLYPRQCIECGSAPGEDYRYLCWDCAARLNLLQAPMCSRCGEPVEGRVDGAFVCHLCVSADRRFTRARSVARFDGAVRTLIHAYKYDRHTWLARDLVRLLEAGWQTHYEDVEIDGVTWVPLHPTRRRARGFNQAQLLAQGLSARLRLPLLRGAVRRDRATATQTHLTAAQRAENVRGAFSCPRPHRVQGRRILLVDDVMTTGATVDEVARSLFRAAAAAVHVLTVARG